MILSVLKTLFSESDWVREIYGTLKILRSKIHYLKHPVYETSIKIVEKQGKSEADFNDFFTAVEAVERQDIQRLGINVPSRKKADQDGANWLAFLRSHGLNAEHSVLDYGCGSLRLGVSIIRFLKSKNYTGVDISNHFYDLGIKNYLGQSNLAEKNPTFGVIGSAEYKALIESKTYDFIYSRWVFMHVHPNQLEQYFSNIRNLMHERSLFYFDMTPSLFTLRQNALTWGYSIRNIKKIVHSYGLDCERVVGNLYSCKIITAVGCDNAHAR